MKTTNYLAAYPADIQAKIAKMLEQDTLAQFLLKKYPRAHELNNDKALRAHAMAYKTTYLKKSPPISDVSYDGKIHVIHNALGLHSYEPRVQGNKIKTKNRIKISALFKNVPIEFLDMILVHELAHLREREHNKAFYQLCQHMLADYHQLEFDLRVYLTQVEQRGDIY